MKLISRLKNASSVVLGKRDLQPEDTFSWPVDLANWSTAALEAELDVIQAAREQVVQIPIRPDAALRLYHLDSRRCSIQIELYDRELRGETK